MTMFEEHVLGVRLGGDVAHVLALGERLEERRPGRQPHHVAHALGGVGDGGGEEEAVGSCRLLGTRISAQGPGATPSFFAAVQMHGGSVHLHDLTTGPSIGNLLLLGLAPAVPEDRQGRGLPLGGIR